MHELSDRRQCVLRVGCVGDTIGDVNATGAAINGAEADAFDERGSWWPSSAEESRRGENWIGSVDHRHPPAASPCLPFRYRPSYPHRPETTTRAHVPRRVHPSGLVSSSSSSPKASDDPNKPFFFFLGSSRHDCWTYCCQAISEGRRSSAFDPSPCTHVYPPQGAHPPAVELLEKGIVEDYDWFTGRALRLIEANLPPPSSSSVPHSDQQQPWVRPGFDGLVIHTNPLSSAVSDSFYT